METMDRTKQDRISIDQTAISLLFIISRYADSLYLFFQACTRTRSGPANFMRDYLISTTAFSMMSTAMFFISQLFYIPIKSTIGRKHCIYSGKYGRILSIKITSMMVDYLAQSWLFLSWALCKSVDMLGKWIGAAFLLISRNVPLALGDLDTLAF